MNIFDQEIDFNDGTVFKKTFSDKIYKLTIMDKLFEQNGEIIKNADTKVLDELIILTKESIIPYDLLPF